MSEQDVREIKQLLKKAGVKPGELAQQPRDLWPAMLERLSRAETRVPWWDWILLAGTCAALWFFPVIVPALLYHL